MTFLIDFTKKNQGLFSIGASEWYAVYEKWTKREKTAKVSSTRFGRMAGVFAAKDRKKTHIVYSGVGNDMAKAVLKAKLLHEYEHRKQFAPLQKDERRQHVVKVVRVEVEDALYRFRDFVADSVGRDQVEQQGQRMFDNPTLVSNESIVRKQLLELLDAFIGNEEKTGKVGKTPADSGS